MTFESLKGKINVLEIVGQRVPGSRWRRPGTLDTGWQSADRYSLCLKGFRGGRLFVCVCVFGVLPEMKIGWTRSIN